jgi:hypothetical protein
MSQRRRRRIRGCGCKGRAQGSREGCSGHSGGQQGGPDSLLVIASKESEQTTYQNSQNAKKYGPADARYQASSSMGLNSFLASGANRRRSQVHWTWWALTPATGLLEPRHSFAGPADASLGVFVPRIDGQHPSQIGQTLAGVISQASLPEESLFVVRIHVQNSSETSTGISPPAHIRREDAQPQQVIDLTLFWGRFEPPLV